MDNTKAAILRSRIWMMFIAAGLVIASIAPMPETPKEKLREWLDGQMHSNEKRIEP